MKERLIDNCILYVLGIFLMIGMSGWVRPVIVVLIALLHITLSDLIPGKRLRYIEMGAFVGVGAAMPDHALMLFLPLLLYDCVRMRSWKAGVITGAGVLCQMVWFVQGEIGVFYFDSCGNLFRAHRAQLKAGAGGHPSEGFVHGTSPCDAKKAAGSVGKAGL